MSISQYFCDFLYCIIKHDTCQYFFIRFFNPFVSDFLKYIIFYINTQNTNLTIICIYAIIILKYSFLLT